jgi:hypothetical protein
MFIKLLSVACLVASGSEFAAAQTPTDWNDCGAPNATLHFTNVTSDPDPVHKGDKQTITK